MTVGKDNRSRNIIIFALLLLALALKISMVTYGLPYLFHPDEPYIFKDPFKLFYKYKNLDFSHPTNLYFWVLLLWYGFYFGGGLLTGKVHSMSEFQDLLITEDPDILVHGRILSILLSLAGSYFLLRIFSKITKDKILFILFGLMLVLNPIEMMSDLWIKFDPATYFFLSFLLYLAYRFFQDNEEKLRNRIYFLSFVAISLRVDLIAFGLAFAFIDWRKIKGTTPLVSHIRNLVKPCALGVLAYSLITLLPLIFLAPANTDMQLEVPVTKSFENAILSKYATLSASSIAGIIGSNLLFYLVTVSIVSLGPFLVFPALVSIRKKFRDHFTHLLMIVFLILFLPLIFFTYHAPHYYLLCSIAIFLLGLNGLSQLVNKKVTYSIAAAAVAYMGSLTGELVYSINCKTDARLEARDLLLQKTTPQDLIGINKFLNAGFYPPIQECPDVLRDKVEAIKKYHMGTGKTFALMAEKVDKNKCRAILEVSSPKRFEGTEYENRWAIGYEADLLLNKDPRYFVSMTQEFPNDSFTVALRTGYALKTVVSPDFRDPRMELMLANENFFPTFFIYERRQGMHPHQ